LGRGSRDSPEERKKGKIVTMTHMELYSQKNNKNRCKSPKDEYLEISFSIRTLLGQKKLSRDETYNQSART